MAEFNVFAGIICVVFLLLLLYRENSKKDRRRIAWRLIATIAAILSLYLLLTPVKCKTKRIPKGTVAILLTTGYHEDSLKHLLNQFPKAVLFDEFSLWKIDKSFQTLHIIGNGLNVPVDPHSLPHEIVFHPGPSMNRGINFVSWNKKIVVGEPLVVQGTYHNKTGKPHRIYLSSSTATNDSMITATENEKITLQTVPKVIGYTVYRLFVMEGKDTLENNAIPVKVVDVQKPAVLILASSPDFENRFLQSWLAESRYKVINRTRISKGKFERNFYNTVSRPLQQITQQILDSINVLIIDQEEINRLSAGERKLVVENLSQDKIGLLISADNGNAGKQFFDNKEIIRVRSILTERVGLIFKGRQGKVFINNNGQLNYITNETSIVSIISDSAGHTFAGHLLYQKGKIVYSIMPALFPLMLSGDKKAYADTWTYLLQQATPGKTDSVYVVALTPFPQVNKPLQIAVSSADTSFPEIMIHGKRMALQQHEMLPASYTSIYWPHQTGWQNVTAGNRKIFSIYVFDSTDWKHIRTATSLEYTYKILNEKRRMKSLKEGSLEVMRTHASPVYWFVLFILSAGFLWFERKLL